MLEIGIGIVDITPKIGTPLSGFAARGNKPSVSVASSLEVHVIAFKAGNEASFIISFDLLGIGRLLESQIIVALGNELGGIFNQNRCVLVATHTHSAPPTIEFSGEATPNLEYLKWISSQTVQAAKSALRQMKPAYLYKASLTISGLTYNRRALLQDGRISIVPEPELPVVERGPLDALLTVLLWRDLEGRNIAAIIHFPCHGVALLTQSIAADLPGEICLRIGKLLDVPCLYLQGATGDINPTALVSGREDLIVWMDDFMKQLMGLESEFQLVEQEPLIMQASSLYLDYLPLPSKAHLEQRLHHLDIISRGDFQAQEVQDTMPFLRELMHAKPDDSLDPVLTKHIAQALAQNTEKTIERIEEQDKPTPCKLSIAIWRLGEIVLVFIAAEVFAITGLKIKELNQGLTILPVSYLAPLVGYLPDLDSVSKGGYEVDYAWRFYGHIAPFAPDSEQRVIVAIDQLISKITKD